MSPQLSIHALHRMQHNDMLISVLKQTLRIMGDIRSGTGSVGIDLKELGVSCRNV